MLAGEFAFGKVEQRLETLERLHLPVPDSGEQQVGLPVRQMIEEGRRY